ncbi:hypothetical protein M378DRAFT_156534 [Amanita muscaria Koide BX008]|uniref:Uncharacterized protein n=1 Tax=Amanita muscaria (strain Koide BX008) TaxID=946122 RepID=A0A0C2TSY0_AMAMK|nr:hypothetical protein M378DRAFT_156534 [Amanita muscaria Koide BX008]
MPASRAMPGGALVFTSRPLPGRVLLYCQPSRIPTSRPFPGGALLYCRPSNMPGALTFSVMKDIF